MRCPLSCIRSPYSQPRPVIVDSNLRIIEATEINVMNPIVFSCANPRSPSWTKAEEIISKAGGELLWCGMDENGR